MGRCHDLEYLITQFFLIFYSNEWALRAGQNCAVKVYIVLVPLGFCSLLGCFRRYLATDHTMIAIYALPLGEMWIIWFTRGMNAIGWNVPVDPYYTQAPCSISLSIDRNVETRASGSFFLSPDTNSCSLEIMGLLSPSHTFKVIW